MTPKHNKAYRQRRSEDEPNGTPKCGPKRCRRYHGNGRKPRAAAVYHRLDNMADYRFNNYKERKRPQKHRPAGIDGDRKGERECSGDDGAYVWYEAEYRRQDAPEDRTWNDYEPKA